MFKFMKLRATKTGNEYEMPVEVVVAHRVNALIKERKLEPAGGEPEQIRAFMQGPVQDLQNEVLAAIQTEDDVRMYCGGIPWNQVAPFTRLVKFGAPAYDLIDDMEWLGGGDEPQPIAEVPEGTHSGEIPIDFFLAMMDKNKNNTTMAIMKDGDGQKNCIMIVFRGTHDAVEACEALVGQLAAQIKQFPDGKPARKQFPH